MISAFLLAAAGAAVLSWLTLTLELIPWRRRAGEHWTIRAQKLMPLRIAAATNLWVILLLCVVIGWIGWRMSWLPLVLGGLLGVVAGGYPIDRRVAPETTGRTWIGQVVVALVFRILRWATLVAAILLMPVEFTGATLAITGAYLSVTLGLSFGLGLRALRAIGVLQPASSRLARVVEEARATHGANVRATWELATTEAGAYAVTTTRELIFTRVLLTEVSDDELRAICVHEMAHLAESRWVLAGRVLGSLAVMPILYFRPVEARFGLNGVIALVALAGAACWLRSRLTHTMEKHADHAAVNSTPDAAAYAHALEKIYRANRMPVVQRQSGLNTHPDLYDRMIAAGVTPSYPRPLPPRSVASTSIILVAAFTVLLLSLVIK